jgi:hypothetical protein
MTPADAVTGVDAGPKPVAFRAKTFIEYVVPLVNPFTTHMGAPLVLHFDFVTPSVATTL